VSDDSDVIPGLLESSDESDSEDDIPLNMLADSLSRFVDAPDAKGSSDDEPPCLVASSDDNSGDETDDANYQPYHDDDYPMEVIPGLISSSSEDESSSEGEDDLYDYEMDDDYPKEVVPDLISSSSEGDNDRNETISPIHGDCTETVLVIDSPLSLNITKAKVKFSMGVKS
jgi:hypothetical protein